MSDDTGMACVRCNLPIKCGEMISKDLDNVCHHNSRQCIEALQRELATANKAFESAKKLYLEGVTKQNEALAENAMLRESVCEPVSDGELQKFGEFLSDRFDEDEWPNAERLLNGVLLERVRLHTAFHNAPHAGDCTRNKKCAKCGASPESGYHDMGHPAGAAHKFEPSACSCWKRTALARIKGEV